VYGVKYKGRQLSIGEKGPAGAGLTLMGGGGGGKKIPIIYSKRFVSL